MVKRQQIVGKDQKIHTKDHNFKIRARQTRYSSTGAGFVTKEGTKLQTAPGRTRKMDNFGNIALVTRVNASKMNLPSIGKICGLETQQQHHT